MKKIIIALLTLSTTLSVFAFSPEPTPAIICQGEHEGYGKILVKLYETEEMIYAVIQKADTKEIIKKIEELEASMGAYHNLMVQKIMTKEGNMGVTFYLNISPIMDKRETVASAQFRFTLNDEFMTRESHPPFEFGCEANSK